MISPYDPEKRIWIIDDDMHEINIFTNDGKLVKTMGERGVPGDVKQKPYQANAVAGGKAAHEVHCGPCAASMERTARPFPGGRCRALRRHRGTVSPWRRTTRGIASGCRAQPPCAGFGASYLI